MNSTLLHCLFEFRFFAITAKIRTLFLSHIKITNYLTLKHGTFNLRRYVREVIRILKKWENRRVEYNMHST